MLAETQKLINQIRPEVFEQYEGVNDTSLDSFVGGWLSWVFNKKHTREDGTKYNSVSPHTREQVRCWVKEGRPHTWDGGLDDDAEAEHDRASLARERQTDPPVQKTRRRKRRTTA